MRIAFAIVVVAVVACGGAEDEDAVSSAPDPTQVLPPTPRKADDVPISNPETELRMALERLLRGPVEPGPEHTWFSAVTADALRSASVDSAGNATVDFDDLRTLIPNASSSAGSALLLEDLNSTVFSVNGIESVEYRMEGSCASFWEWLQYSCQVVRRSER